MDAGIGVAIVTLVVWAVWTFFGNAPGWAHSLLMAGMFLLIYRIVARGTPGYKSGQGGRSIPSNSQDRTGGNGN